MKIKSNVKPANTATILNTFYLINLEPNYLNSFGLMIFEKKDGPTDL